MFSGLPIQTLKIKEFRNLLTGRLLLVMSFRMLSTLLGWWVYSITKDPLSIGLIGLSEVIPALSSALYAGYVIDTQEKKKLLLLCNLAYILLIGILAAAAYFSQTTPYVGGIYVVYIIYGIIFFTGIARAFIGPLVPSMIPKMVGTDKLPSAVTLNQATFLTASVGGHAAGGFLIDWFGIAHTLQIIVGMMIIAFLFFVRLQRYPSENTGKTLALKESLREGLAYIYHTKEILGALMLDMFAVLFGGAVAMIPVYAADILHVGSTGFGMLNAASDIGSMLVIIALNFFPLKKNQGRILLFAVAGFGLCIVGFGLSSFYWLSFVMLLFSGMLDGISVVIRGTIVQLKTPENIRGRVLSVNSMFIMSSNELGQLESGVAAKLLGPVRSVVLGGCATIAIALAVGATNKKLVKMEY